MPKPIIGINTGLRPVKETGRALEMYLYAEYADAVAAAGGVPVLLPPLENTRDAGAMLAAVGGVLLTGGTDPHPRAWGEALHPKADLMHPRRDRFDLVLAKAAVRRRVPILGICSGAQCISIALGGSLHQHLYDVYETSVQHHGQKDNPRAHAVKVEPRSRLARVIGAVRLQVNSSHHQSISRAGRDVRVAAVCPSDGVVEGIEHKDPERFVLGVQWHPETLRGRRTQRRLFTALVSAARRG